MNLNPLILSALKKVAETQTNPIQEIILTHPGKVPTFTKRTVIDANKKVAPGAAAELVRKQLVAAKLCVLSKTCQSSLTSRGKDVLALHIRFEEGKKPTWSVASPPRELANV